MVSGSLPIREIKELGIHTAYGHSGHDSHIAANPAVIADDYGLSKLNAVTARLYLSLVGCREDGDEGPEQNSVPDRYQAAVQYHEAIK